MITRTPSYKTDDGEVFATLTEAQEHELCSLTDDVANGPANGPDVAKWIVKNKEKILDILTTTEKSKVRARSVNGGTKKRTPKTPAVAEMPDRSPLLTGTPTPK